MCTVQIVLQGVAAVINILIPNVQNQPHNPTISIMNHANRIHSTQNICMCITVYT